MMCLTQTFLVLLLLGLELREVDGDCDYSPSKEYCLCTLKDEASVESLIQCIPATVFEIRGGNLEELTVLSEFTPSHPLFGLLETLSLTKLIAVDVLLPAVLLPAFLKFLSYTRVSELEFESCTFLGTTTWDGMSGLDLPVLSLRFHNVSGTSLANTDFSSLSRWLETLQRLTVTESQLTHIPCSTGKIFKALRFLDISGNHFQDQSLELLFCQGAFPQLQVLKLHRNNLTSYQTTCETLHQLSNLIHLDLSHNGFSAPLSSCVWPQSLHVLNLSNTGLEYMNLSLPQNIEVLDLSSNTLHSLDLALALPLLTELYLSNNSLHAVPPMNHFPALEVLSLDGNLISRLPRDELRSLQHLRSVKAGHNHYVCSCSGAREIQGLVSTEPIMLDWPQDYVCDSPSQYQGFLVKDVPTSTLECNRAQLGQGPTFQLFGISLSACLSAFLR
uniref:Monocyte differentiation antigen CD14 n=1 Tax=Sphenodon punctatus TaxID=8508 RepID=A0A8D0HGD8_SPHPU